MSDNPAHRSVTRKLVSLTAAIAALSLVPLAGANAQATVDDPENETFDRWIVSVDPGARLSVATLDDVSDIDGVDVVMEIDDGVEVIETESLTLDEVEQLVDEPGLRIEPDYPAQLASVVPDDTLFSLQWGLSNPDNGFDIGAPDAWAYLTDAPDVVVAVIDSGVDAAHEDLAGNMWSNPGEVVDGTDTNGNGFVDDVFGWDFVADAPAGNDPNGHGTHVAGTIGAETDNGIGVAGVAWDVQLMDVRAFDETGAGNTSDIMAAVRYAIDNDADVINASFSGRGTESYAELLDEADAAGIAVIAAASNDGSDNDADPMLPYPANHSTVVSVAAIDSLGDLAEFSNYGATTVDVAAPGVGIASTMAGAYYYMSGTSMAAPHVSGVAALLLQADPSLSPSQVADVLRSTVEPAPQLEGTSITGGFVRADAALASILEAPAVAA
ncbi:MAG: S8 family peptidase [Actinomycetota bacterium]